MDDTILYYKIAKKEEAIHLDSAFLLFTVVNSLPVDISIIC